MNAAPIGEPGIFGGPRVISRMGDLWHSYESTVTAKILRRSEPQHLDQEQTTAAIHSKIVATRIFGIKLRLLSRSAALN